MVVLGLMLSAAGSPATSIFWDLDGVATVVKTGPTHDWGIAGMYGQQNQKNLTASCVKITAD